MKGITPLPLFVTTDKHGAVRIESSGLDGFDPLTQLNEVALRSCHRARSQRGETVSMTFTIVQCGEPSDKTNKTNLSRMFQVTKIEHGRPVEPQVGAFVSIETVLALVGNGCAVIVLPAESRTGDASE